MHYLTLAAVNIPQYEEEHELNEVIDSEISELQRIQSDASENNNSAFISSIMMRLKLSRLIATRTTFAREVLEAIDTAMEPYCESTENPEYLEFEDMTEEAKREYLTGSQEMVRLPNGSLIFPWDDTIRKQFSVHDSKVYQRDAGPCHHEKRTKKAKKMQVVVLPYRKIFSTFDLFATEHCHYQRDEENGLYGYYYNPNAFWDWYSVGGRWPYEFLVKADCTEYSLGEREREQETPLAPEGYIWVSAARKKDIAWDVMQEWNRQQAIEQYHTLVTAFAIGVMPKDTYGVINEEEILGFRDFIYKKDETEDEYLKRHHINQTEKYGYHPYAFLDENGWNPNEVWVYKDGKPETETPPVWEQNLLAFMEKADDDTVFAIIDNHN